MNKIFTRRLLSAFLACVLCLTLTPDALTETASTMQLTRTEMLSASPPP